MLPGGAAKFWVSLRSEHNLRRAVNRQPGNRTNDSESSHAHQKPPESNSTAHEMHMNIFRIKFTSFFNYFSKFSKIFKFLVSCKNPWPVNNFLQTYRFEATNIFLDMSWLKEHQFQHSIKNKCQDPEIFHDLLSISYKYSGSIRPQNSVCCSITHWA